MDDVTLSIIVPVHDARAHLDAFRRRIVRVDLPCEIVLIDDGSTDGTREMLDALAEDDERVRIIGFDRHRGVAHARNVGIAESRGAYVWFCDVDDEWDPALPGVLVAEALASGADLVCTRALRIERDGRRWVMEGVASRTELEGGGLRRAVLQGTVRGHLWNKLFRRSALRPVEVPLLERHEDLVLLAAALPRIRRAVLLPDVLYEYIEHSAPRPAAGPARAADLEVAAAVVETSLGRTASAQEIAAFRLWFLAVPVIASTVHEKWSGDDARAWRRRMRPALTWSAIRVVARRQPAVARHAAVIRVTGPAYPAVYRVARRLSG